MAAVDTGIRVYPEPAPGRDRTPEAPPRWRWAGKLIMLGFVTALVIVSAVAIPKIAVDGDAEIVTGLDFGSGADIPGAQTNSQISENQDGFVIDAEATGTVEVPFELPEPSDRDRVFISITAAGGPDLLSEISLLRPHGPERVLGSPNPWVGERFDVTDIAEEDGSATIEVFAINQTTAPALLLDQVAIGIREPDSVTDASRWLVATWIGLLFCALLQLGGKLRRHWILALGAAIAAWLLWEPVIEEALVPLAPDARAHWEAARGAQLFDLDTGVVSGTFGALSALTVQLFHLLTSITGDGLAGARAASSLVAVGALAAIYAAGNRIAGRIGAVTALVVVLLNDPFRDAATSAGPVPTQILAGALLLIAIHVCLSRTSAPEAVLVGLAGALMVIADSVVWPGVVVVLIVLVAAYGLHGQRLRTSGIAILTLSVVLLPGRVSVANQNDGDLLADVKDRATLARNIEFVGEGHGAPDTEEELSQDPLGGERVGLGEYLIGEHSASVLIGGALTGLYDALSEASSRDESKLFGLLAFLACVIGSLYLLILPRLRMLILLPIIVAAIPLFLASKDIIAPFAGGAALWPAFFAAAGVLAYAVAELVGRRLRDTPAFSARRWLPGSDSRTSS